MFYTNIRYYVIQKSMKINYTCTKVEIINFYLICVFTLIMDEQIVCYSNIVCVGFSY